MGSTGTDQTEKNPKVGGVAETMLQTLYARAQESRRPNHKFYDAKAIEVVDRLDYDFSFAAKDQTMSTGVVARTVVLDRMVSGFITRNPEATVVNLACGMDTRFYRADNGRIRWYNVDLPVTMEIRERYLPEGGDRVKNIAASAMDTDWVEQVEPVADAVLVIVEGLTMYLEEEDVRQVLSVIAGGSPHVTVFMEILSPRFVNKDIEKSISQSGAVFTWGAKSGRELERLCPSLVWRGDRSLVEGMEEIYPVFKAIGKIGVVRSLSNKIAVLEK